MPCKRCKKMLETIVPEINVVYTYHGVLQQCIPTEILRILNILVGYFDEFIFNL